MVEFRNIVKDSPLTAWWDNGNNQIAFCRKSKGFLVVNNEGNDLEQSLQTCLPKGSYCNVISGRRNGTSCTGDTVEVGEDGMATIRVPIEIGILAIHIGVRSIHPSLCMYYSLVIYNHQFNLFCCRRSCNCNSRREALRSCIFI